MDTSLSAPTPASEPARQATVAADNLKAALEYLAIMRDPVALARIDAELDAWEDAP